MEQIEKDIQANLFIEAGIYKDHLFGASIKVVGEYVIKIHVAILMNWLTHSPSLAPYGKTQYNLYEWNHIVQKYYI